jgi:hypothetical protein
VSRSIALLLAAAALATAAPISLHPDNTHYFLFRGRPLAVVASGEHYGAVLNLDFDYRKYLDAMKRGGMNYTRTFTGAYVEPQGAFGIKRNVLAPASGRFLPPWARSEVAGYAGGGNKFDLSKWNPAYFERLKDFVRYAAEHRIIVEITLFCSTYADAQWAVNPFNSANNVNSTEVTDWRFLNTLENGNVLAMQERMVRKIVAELNEFDNVIYEIQNEPWPDRQITGDMINPYMHEHHKWPNSVDYADAKSLAWQARIAQIIVDEESRLPNKHLIAQNYVNFGAPIKGIAPGVSIVNFHYAYPHAVRQNFHEGKLIACDETGFMGRADLPYRRQAWEFMLSGGGAFNHLDYSFSVGFEDGTEPEREGPSGGGPALRKQLKVLSDFIHSFDLPRLAPNYELVRRSGGLVAHAISQGSDAHGVYLRGAGPAEIELVLPAGRYSAEWIDTKTGAITPSDLTHPSGTLKLTVPACAEDIALRLRKK